MSRLKKVRPLGLLAVLLTAACGTSPQSLNPTGPSAFAGASVAFDEDGGVSDAAAVNVQANGKPNDKGKPDDKGKPEPAPVPPTTSPDSPEPPASPVTRTIQIEGVIAAISGRSVTVNGHDVVVPDGTVIRHGSRAVAFSELRIGDRVHIKGRLHDGVLEASEVKLQNSGHGDDADEDEDEEVVPVVVPVVTVAAFDASASETAADPGTFRFTRTGSTTSPLTVSYTLTGTAVNGTDYQTLALTVTFLAEHATTDRVVMPSADGDAEGSETVILTVTDGAAYDVGASATATVTIAG